ncbi:RNA polymerase sigma factor [Cyclobacterium qasimii]|uniref:RNA polymerase, sigma-24 subunit, ECF subfamily n=2 Tax=Cyclobacterium qasimii TaxID=1350429 RepID=S7WSC8_9BACT|nr:RNA polymerase sigma factor [Cyclobacterium qasimii]EPR69639.1 RNA polymerase, sigma-24 subunit, ECF subfamily [Cyclobacterium qasimii M12-11B]GEO21471.1 RNA polymerase sigma factor [Cyclobacterium qasimii]
MTKERQLNDENLMLMEMAGGNEKPLDYFYSKYAAKVYSTVLSYTKNEEDAEELLQDVFVTLFDSADKFKNDASVSTWIYRIAVNKCLDFLRKKNSLKRKGIFSSIFSKETGETVIEPIDFVHPGVKLENAEDATLLFKVLDELTENQKTVFILTQMDGLPQQEVADIMKLSRKSVESLLQRAKASMRDKLEKFYPERGKFQKNTSK